MEARIEQVSLSGVTLTLQLRLEDGHKLSIDKPIEQASRWRVGRICDVDIKRPRAANGEEWVNA
jgi:hypothetical protein